MLANSIHETADGAVLTIIAAGLHNSTVAELAFRAFLARVVFTALLVIVLTLRTREAIANGFLRQAESVFANTAFGCNFGALALYAGLHVKRRGKPACVLTRAA